jgi:hypothetical protein
MSAKQTAESFWSHVDVRSLNECWPWLRSTNKAGYGTVKWCGKTYVATRVAAWLLGFIETLSCPVDRRDSGFVLHSCDNPPCCNPTHWYIGTLGLNQKDAYARQLRKPLRGGIDHVNAKLSPAQVRAIRRKYVPKVTRQCDIASKYGVSQSVISATLLKRNYAWVSA